ncbi:hypothetical protein V490_09166 [Pseudogymnoascus sp. VKM F-3557]|nr:hypothetical protein V490_09166 [Pseudogymnoascus sp. VKM F-3557]
MPATSLGLLAHGLWPASTSVTSHCTPLFSMNRSCTKVGSAASTEHFKNAIFPANAGSAHAGTGATESNAANECGRSEASRVAARVAGTSA